MNNPHSELTTVIITNRFDQRFWKAVKSAYWSSMLVLVDPDAEKNDLLLKKQIDTLKKKYPQIQVLIGKSKVEDFSEVRNEALSLIKTPWAFFMDSDEWMDRNLEHAILQAISSHQSLDAYKVYRQDFFLNKPLLHGEPASVALVRLGKVKGGKWQGKVHENWEFPNECGELTSFLFHEPHTSITEFIGKINVYTTLVAEERITQQRKTTLLEMMTYPTGKFFQNYLFRSGWKDGWRGLSYALMMSFHSLFVRVKMWEIQLSRHSRGR